MTFTDRKIVDSWIRTLVANGITNGWAIVIRDLHNNYEYPYFFPRGGDVKEYIRDVLRVGAEKVCEVYNLGEPIEPQLERGGELVIPE